MAWGNTSKAGMVLDDLEVASCVLDLEVVVHNKPFSVQVFEKRGVHNKPFSVQPEIDQKSVLDCSLFRQHSYFSLRRRKNSQGYWYYVNYDLHSMPSSHKPLYDFALNRHQKSTRRAVSISMQ